MTSAVGCPISAPQESEGLLIVKLEEDCSSGQEISIADHRTSPEIYHQCFRHFCYQQAAGPRQAFIQLQELCHRWLRPEIHSKEQILELLVLEQFLTILPGDIQARVREQHPESGEEAVTLVEELQKEHERCRQQVTIHGQGQAVPLKETSPLRAAQEPPNFKLEPSDIEQSPCLGLQELLGPSPNGGPQSLQERASSTPWVSILPSKAEGTKEKETTGSQLPETFEDVAIYLSQEEWGHQELSKKALSREAMQENEHVVALESHISSQDPATLVEQKEKSWDPSLQCVKEQECTRISSIAEEKKENKEENSPSEHFVEKQPQEMPSGHSEIEVCWNPEQDKSEGQYTPSSEERLGKSTAWALGSSELIRPKKPHPGEKLHKCPSLGATEGSAGALCDFREEFYGELSLTPQHAYSNFDVASLLCLLSLVKLDKMGELYIFLTVILLQRNTAGIFRSVEVLEKKLEVFLVGTGSDFSLGKQNKTKQKNKPWITQD
ncbi:zinc finger protein 263 isoform X3 [Sarcophilus harrisii]|uniref:zinc finger protein 263 isoform X3 n=1 Tax=Sarcophilus harrisii TaxID=9305 RepID=UPI000C7DDCD4|nr:zinc finger protein 263 isoform X3 [Sarcophilus harrisii]